MDMSEIALPVRPGEHARCRFARPEDRERLSIAFVRAGLRRRYKVVYLYERDERDPFVERLRAADDRVAPSLASGQLELRPARQAAMPDGPFESGRMAATLRADHRRALVEGFAGIAIAGEVAIAMPGEARDNQLMRYEEAFAREPFDPTRVLLCHYPHDRFSPALQPEVTAHHDIDASPELAPIGRDSPVSAARVRSDQTLRLAGELDFDGAPAVGDVLAAHFHGPLRLDLTDLTFVDVAGMRALRGQIGQPMTISGASAAVRRLAKLLAWDTDPDVELPEAA